jgi:hypothetical protein
MRKNVRLYPLSWFVWGSIPSRRNPERRPNSPWRTGVSLCIVLSGGPAGKLGGELPPGFGERLTVLYLYSISKQMKPWIHWYSIPELRSLYCSIPRCLESLLAPCSPSLSAMKLTTADIVLLRYLLFKQHLPLDAIAARFNVTDRIVRRWRRKYQLFGGPYNPRSVA